MYYQKLQLTVTSIGVLFALFLGTVRAHADVIASQDFGSTNFPADLNLDSGDIGTLVTHSGSGASGTDLGFSANGLTSTTSGGRFEVADGEVSAIHFSSLSDVSTLAATDVLSGASTVTFDQGTDHTAFFYTETVDLSTYTQANFSMDVGDAPGATNTGDDDILVRLWVNNATEVVLLDTRGNSNGAVADTTLTHSFADADVSAQLLIDLFTDDEGDGYRFDNVSFEGSGGATSPDLIGLLTTGVTHTTATIRWETRLAADSTIRYGTDADNLNQLENSSALTTDHSITLTNLAPNTSYFFEVESSDGGSFTPSAVGDFRTEPGPSFQQGINGYTSSLHRIITSADPANSYIGEIVTVDLNTSDFGGSAGESQLLVRFDDIIGSGANQIPAGVFIESATLLTQTNNPTPGPVGLYQLLSAWDDNTVSWNSFSGGVQPDGVDAKTTPDDSKSDIAASDLLAWDVTNTLRDWVAGSGNHGWAFITESGNGWDVHTELSSLATSRPRLEVIYSNTFPDIYGVEITDIGSFSATLSWVTRVTTTASTVSYGTDPGNLNQQVNFLGGSTTNVISLAALLPETTYFFEVVSSDGGSFTASATGSFTTGIAPPDGSGTDKIRLIWTDDPSTTATIGWNQIVGGDATVHWGPNDLGTDAEAYPNASPVDRAINYKGMENRFVRLSGLSPDQNYYFVLKGDGGTSPRFWFRTGPGTAQPFTFIAGGDSRNNQIPRQNANRMVAKLRPLFVAFNGDMTDGDSSAEWAEWLDDWQLTFADDGRIFPIVPARGNHEDSNAVLVNIFDLPNPDNYYALSLAGNLLRLYSLNSEIPAGGTQRTWLANDLQTNAVSHSWSIANYHKPMRPHTSSKSEGSDEYNNWADLFYNYGVDLVVESDTHMMKRTFPIRPSASGADEGFVRDNANGTVYIGEGCWGAPLRSANDGKSWTRALDSFNGFDWITVYPERLEVRTVKVDNAQSVGAVDDAMPFTLPPNIELWAPTTGTVLHIPYREPEPASVIIDSGDEWKFLDDGTNQGTAWKEPDFDDSGWATGTTEFGYGDGDESTIISFGSDQQDKHITSYFRKAFRMYQPYSISVIQLDVLRDDGIIVYLNGEEILRDNLPTGTVDHETFSSSIISGADEDVFLPFFFSGSKLNHGRNVIAAEVHNRDGSSSDLSFDLKLSAEPTGPIFEVTYDGYRQVTFDEWQLAQGPDEDSDGDFISNLEEFFFGSDANNRSSRPVPASVTTVEGDMTFSFVRRKDTSVEWSYLFSENLEGWGEMTEGVDFTESIDSVPSSDLETVTLTMINPPATLFLQIMASQ